MSNADVVVQPFWPPDPHAQLEAQMVACTHAVDRLHNAVVANRPLAVVAGLLYLAQTELAAVEQRVQACAAAEA
jgi:hypothetical protein